MTFLLILPAILSLLVLGAHFLRGGHVILLGATLAVLVCLAVRRRWVPRLVQAVLVLGALEWVITLAGLASERMRAGEPAVRLAIILGAVALVSALSALVFETATLKRRYGR